MWSSFENRLNLANGVSTPCGATSIATEQQVRETGTELLDNETGTVFGPRVTDQATDPTGTYIYGRPTNTCCDEDFIDHKSWKDHMKKHHSNTTSTYHCSKCSRAFPSIFGVSSHFPKCVLPTTSPTGDLEFRCPNCEASFSSKRGLGVHRRRKHPAEHEADQNIQRTKERWTQEELLFMAEREASIPIHITNRNQLLHPYFPHRTIESIKGVRKGERYRQLLQTAKDNISQKPFSDEPTTINADSPPPAQPDNTTIPPENSTTNATSIPTSNSTSNLPSRYEDPFLHHLQAPGLHRHQPRLGTLHYQQPLWHASYTPSP